MNYTITKNIKIPYTDRYLVEGSKVSIENFCNFPYVLIRVNDAPQRNTKQAIQGDTWALLLNSLI